MLNCDLVSVSVQIPQRIDTWTLSNKHLNKSSWSYILPGSATTPLTASHRMYVWKHLFSCTSHHLFKHQLQTLVPSSTIRHSLGDGNQQEQSYSILASRTAPVWAANHCHSKWVEKRVPLSWCSLLGSIYLTLEISLTVSSLEAEQTRECGCTVLTLSKLPIAVILYFNAEQEKGTWRY